MHKKRIVLALILLTILALAISACGGNSSTKVSHKNIEVFSSNEMHIGSHNTTSVTTGDRMETKPTAAKQAGDGLIFLALIGVLAALTVGLVLPLMLVGGRS